MTGRDPGRPEGAGTDLRVNRDDGVLRGGRLTLDVDGHELVAFRGETVAAALVAAGHRILRTTAAAGAPRGLFCGMGTCFECLMVIDGKPSQRVCVTLAEEGMRVRTQVGPGATT
jgi:Uncharacterized anaerobic dehydrogenase